MRSLTNSTFIFRNAWPRSVSIRRPSRKTRALPTVLTHLNLPGKPIKPQSIQKFAAELNVPYAVLRDLYTRVRCQGKVRTKYVIGMMPKGETALLAMMIKNTLTYRSIPMTDFSEMTGIPLDQLMYPPRKPSDAFVAGF